MDDETRQIAKSERMERLAEPVTSIWSPARLAALKALAPMSAASTMHTPSAASPQKSWGNGSDRGFSIGVVKGGDTPVGGVPREPLVGPGPREAVILCRMPRKGPARGRIVSREARRKKSRFRGPLLHPRPLPRLPPPERRVHPAGLQQLLVRPRLHDLPAVQH